MTASVTNAAQGSSSRGSSINTNNSIASKSRPPACYMSTRSAAMMALALGQTSSSGSSNVQRSSTPVHTQSAASPNASPRPSHRNVPSVVASPTSDASRSKPSTPTATRAAVVAALNGGGIFSGGSNSSGSDNDGFSTSGSSTATALRRLYFKSGRSIKNKINASTTSSSATPLNGLPLNPVSSAYHNSVSGMHSMAVAGGGVPKLVVMGTSSASIPDTNINTSTDSASTLITNVTHTDTSETCDSLDLGDNSGPSEPLFSSLEEPLLTAIQIDSEHETSGSCGRGSGGGVGTELELTSCSRYPPRPDMNLQDSTESQESCLSILTAEQSSTTPLLSSQRRQPAGGHSPGSRREERQPSSRREPSTAPPPTRVRDHFTFDPRCHPSRRAAAKRLAVISHSRTSPRRRQSRGVATTRTTRGQLMEEEQQQAREQREYPVLVGDAPCPPARAMAMRRMTNGAAGQVPPAIGTRSCVPGSVTQMQMTPLAHTYRPEYRHRTAGATAPSGRRSERHPPPRRGP
ncbi:pneumococcal serine-rich repeat protein-like [Drosophila subobscura]|uniref:pneumococcal serine-rich repeat protein-like n=1 Tax=Drosophila subobscura TaxID=7241 RepID=UPI00155A4028|nr:pneumococcal serine-rich repeat protein-like [Drosophila subobscura]